MPEPLTTRQAEIFAYIRDSLACGRSPSVREIGDWFEIASSNGVMCHLKALETKGYIVRSSLARSIRLAGDCCPACGREFVK